MKNGAIGANNFKEVSTTVFKVYFAAFLDSSETSVYNLYFTASMYSSQKSCQKNLSIEVMVYAKL